MMINNIARGIILFCLICILMTYGAGPSYGDGLGFGIRDVDLGIAGNTGPVSVIINGSHFSHETTFEVVDAAGWHYAASGHVLINPWRVLSTFNLAGAAPGWAGIRAADGTVMAELSNAFQIGEGLAGNLQIKLDVPKDVQADQVTTLFVNFNNAGHADVDIPLLILSVPDATYLGTEPQGRNLGDYAMILGLPDGPVFTSIRPGESVTIPFYVILESTGPTVATVSAIDPNSPTLAGFSFDYERLRNKTPDPTSPQVQARVDTLQGDFGDNFRNFYAQELAKLGTLVNHSAHLYQKASHVDGRWQLTQAPPQPGNPRPTIIGNPTADVTPSVPSSPGNDGQQKTYAIIIGMGYDSNAYIYGPYADSRNVYNFTRYEMRIPENQINVFFGKRPDGASLTKEDLKDAILNCGADNDDQLIIYYSGHGTQSGAWLMPDTSTEISPSEIESWLTEKNAGQTYLISDSCYSGQLVDKIHAPKTAVIAATSHDNPSYELIGGDGGGYFTSVFLSLLKQGYSMEEAINKAIPIVYGSVSHDFSSYGYIKSPQKPTYDPDGVDMQYPFGQISTYSLDSHTRELRSDLDWAAELIEDFKDYEIPPPPELYPGMTLQLQWADEARNLGIEDVQAYIDEKTEEWRLTQSEGVMRCVSHLINVTESPSATTPFLPGGLAVSQHHHLFYVSDNQNGNLYMYNPLESIRHRRLTLLKGLNHPGDVDMGFQGCSLIYTSGGRVQRKYLGFTAYIVRDSGEALQGVPVLVETEKGEHTERTDADGYLTVMDLLKPSLFDRRVYLTIHHGGGSQMFSVDLMPKDHTFVKLIFTGDPATIIPPIYASGTGSGGGKTSFVPGPGDGDSSVPPAPVSAPIAPGTTSVAPDIPIFVNNSIVSGSAAAPRVVILTPADSLVTGQASQSVAGSVSDASMTQVILDVNGVPQTIPVSDKSFKQNIALTAGVNVITARGINNLGVEAESDPITVTLDAGFDMTSGALSGRVFDQYGFPAANIRVVEENSGQITYTDVDGHYRFTGVLVGRAVIQVMP